MDSALSVILHNNMCISDDILSCLCESPQEQYGFVFHTVAQMFQKVLQVKNKNTEVRLKYFYFDTFALN